VVLVQGATTHLAATTTTTTVRKSSRHKGAAALKPVMEKAIDRAAEKNLESGNDFIVLDHLPDSHSSTVAADCCIVFTPSAGTPMEALSLIRAKKRL
jgi:hypothetical protein